MTSYHYDIVTFMTSQNDD